MKIKINIGNAAFGRYMAVMLTALLMTLSSCSLVYEDDLQPCYFVHLNYDYNLKNADATAAEVEEANIYLFDERGNLVWESGLLKGDELRASNYTVQLPVDPGTYHIIAWAGTSDQGSFELQRINMDYSLAKEELKQHLKLTRASDDNLYHDKKLDRLFHGADEKLVLEPGQFKVHNLRLVKDTNHVQVMLNNVDGSELDPDQFHFEIEADNSRLAHDNMPIPFARHKSHCFAKRFFTTDEEGDMGRLTRSLNKVQTKVTGVVAEHSISRIMENEDMRLRVYHGEDRDKIIDIPLRKYLAASKGDSYSHMSDQEYLDRQDEYHVVFFLDHNNKWDKTLCIYINNWRVVPDQEEDL
ncbi:MAG: FimB/Mfa2 family fimbrial subunit [Muribaculaceae bacterium]|nr:FimB/Mfa2 family fimbrial subunit [Muribaculaceae bacterium]